MPANSRPRHRGDGRSQARRYAESHNQWSRPAGQERSGRSWPASRRALLRSQIHRERRCVFTLTGGHTRRAESFRAHLPLPEPTGREPGSGELLAVLPGTFLAGGGGCGTMMHARSRAHLTVLRRARDMCLRPSTQSRPAAGHPHSGPRRAGPGQMWHAGPGEHITMPVIRRPRPAGRDAGREPGVAAAAAVQRLRRQPRNAAAVRRRAGSAAGNHPVRHAGPGRVPGTGAPVSPGHHCAAAERHTRPARLSAGRCAGHVLGRRARAAVRPALPGPGAPPGAGSYRARRADSARLPPHPAAHAHPRHHQDAGYAARLASELFGGSTREDPSPPATCCTL
jgi:hypothetical protein